MAHKKAGGSTSLGRDSMAQRLGVKLFDGESAKQGSILVRQHGTKIRPGKNVLVAKDYTLLATCNGIVKFSTRKVKKFNGDLIDTKFVSVIPEEK